jgi:membrane protease YdiL (CAAX protease family)
MKIIKNHPVTSFFVITLLWSIGWWTMGKNFEYAVYFGLAAPGLWAIILTIAIYGLSGLRNLLKPVFYWKVNPIYYLLIFVGTFCLFAIISFISTKPLNLSSPMSFWKLLAIILMAIVLSILYEEIGWRGFVLPKLMSRFNGLQASLILGGVWVAWHLPLIYSREPSISLNALIIYSIYLLSMTLIFNWFYFKTGGSVLIVGMLHGVLDAYQWLFFSSLSSSSGAPNNILLIVTVLFIAALVMPFLCTLKGGKIRCGYSMMA